MKLLKQLIVVFSLLLSSSVWSATVTFQDHGILDWGVNFQPNDDLYFDCGLSVANPTCTLGFNLPPGVWMSMVVTAPVEFDLYATLMTGPDFGGYAIQDPPWSTVNAGTSFIFTVDGDVRAGQTQWLTVSVEGNPVAMDYFYANGAYALDAIPETSSVPVPTAGWLLGSGLLGLIGVARRRNSP